MSKKGNSVLQDFLNIGLQIGTGGTVGFEADNGGITSGVTTDLVGKGLSAAGQGLKEVTGAQAAEDTLQLERDQFEESKKNIAADREQAQEKNAADQLRASNLAGGVRRGRKSSSKSASRTASLGSTGDDFLGL